ncbi:hypothetical protein SteCoe_24077 [Stentor coeruleus]|uniref:cystathionine beta-synthase n=1 Tax=Stentor coeruleus TaxID=5963 RepID=A0A1R2BIH2_9CILI|nr:hypothetical protein SteCoe_24077 [Stentor coeruleus]
MAKRNYDRRYSQTRCKWSLGTTELNPHSKQMPRSIPKICNNVLDAIGNTPIIRINNITRQEGILCELLVKCEFFNPGGSIKDRIAKRMFDDLEAEGKIKPGMTIVEPTSGNTGIGLALNASVKGYGLKVCMPVKMSKEKSDILKALGAEIIRTPDEDIFLDERLYFKVAEDSVRDDPNCYMPGQYLNPSNPLAHYDITAEEIYDQLDGNLDYLVVVTGTGGHLTGLSRKLKEKIPGITIIGVDPLGSIVHDPENIEIGEYLAEGIGGVIVPRTTYDDLVDRWYISDDQKTFDYSRKLIRYEGLLVGGSSGAVFWAAVQVAKGLDPSKRVLAIMPDGVRNYLSKFVSDRWMIQNDLMNINESKMIKIQGKTVRDLNIKRSLTSTPKSTVREIIEIMISNNVTDIPIIENKKIIGVASSNEINQMIVEGNISLDESVRSSLNFVLKFIKMNTSLAFVSVWLQDNKYAVIHDDDFIGLVYPINISKLLLGNSL